MSWVNNVENDLQKESQKIWIDERLPEECMEYLKQQILKVNPEEDGMNEVLAGNISKSTYLKDEYNWFYNTFIKNLTERMFYRNWDNYYQYHIEKKDDPPEFFMKNFWVNFQRENEFNPLHDHSGLFSFVIFFQIPTNWEEQHDIPISRHSNSPSASDFQFVWTEKSGRNRNKCFLLSPKDEGRILFFPAGMQHQVYPFYNCKQDRITISGNIMRVIKETNPILIQQAKNSEGGVIGEYEKEIDLLESYEDMVERTKQKIAAMERQGAKLDPDHKTPHQLAMQGFKDHAMYVNETLDIPYPKSHPSPFPVSRKASQHEGEIGVQEHKVYSATGDGETPTLLNSKKKT